MCVPADSWPQDVALAGAARLRNAALIADALQRHPKVARVYYPGLRDHDGHEIAVRQMNDFGMMVSFDLCGGGSAAERFIDSLKLWCLAPSLGGVESTVSYPVLSSHIGLSAKQLALLGCRLRRCGCRWVWKMPTICWWIWSRRWREQSWKPSPTPKAGLKRGTWRIVTMLHQIGVYWCYVRYEESNYKTSSQKRDTARGDGQAGSCHCQRRRLKATASH